MYSRNKQELKWALCACVCFFQPRPLHFNQEINIQKENESNTKKEQHLDALYTKIKWLCRVQYLQGENIF